MPFGKISKRFHRRFQKNRVPFGVKRYVKRALDSAIEDKSTADSMVTLYSPITNTWYERDLTDIATGTDLGARIGRRIRIKSFEMRGVLQGGQSNLATDDSSNIVRMVLGLYAGGQSSTVTPLADASASLSTPITRNYNTGGRLIRKFVDKYITLVTAGPTGGAGYLPAQRVLKIYKRFKRPIVIDFSSVAANWPNKRMILSFLSDSVLAPSPGFVCGYFKIIYEDA